VCSSDLAHEFRGNFCAVGGRARNAEILFDHGHIETRKMKYLEHVRVRQQSLQVRRVVAAAGSELHHVAVAVAARHLDETKPIPVWIEAHGLAIDGNRIAKRQTGRQIFVMNVKSHGPVLICG